MAGSRPHSAGVPGTQAIFSHSRGGSVVHRLWCAQVGAKGAGGSKGGLGARAQWPTTLTARVLAPPTGPFHWKKKKKTPLSDHVKQACQNRDVKRREPMGASVYIAEGARGGPPTDSRPRTQPPYRHLRAAHWVRSGTLSSGGRRRGSTLLGGPRRSLSAAVSPPASLAVLGVLCGSSPGPKPPASAPGGHAGERMSQRDTLVHLFAGGYGRDRACGLGPGGWAEAEGRGLR